MARYFMHLAYRGEPFHGWQSQPNAVSVQSTIEQALSTYMRQPVKITGAGRTDTGVNASMMVAHFDLDTPLEHPDQAIRALNSLLGRNIVVYSIDRVHDDAHARFDAESRTYHYYVHTGKSPFLYPLSWQAPATLDYDLMNEAATTLLDVDDFTSFAKLHTDVKTNICDVTEARWEDLGGGRRVFIISANRFLRNMVRAVTGTLVDVGRHKLTVKEFGEIIERRDRCAAGTSMPPHPLFLQNITYSYWRPSVKTTNSLLI